MLLIAFQTRSLEGIPLSKYHLRSSIVFLPICLQKDYVKSHGFTGMLGFPVFGYISLYFILFIGHVFLTLHVLPGTKLRWDRE